MELSPEKAEKIRELLETELRNVVTPDNIHTLPARSARLRDMVRDVIREDDVQPAAADDPSGTGTAPSASEARPVSPEEG